jgi:hypothetical protein
MINLEINNARIKKAFFKKGKKKRKEFKRNKKICFSY